jgi:hypothetical protein
VATALGTFASCHRCSELAQRSPRFRVEFACAAHAGLQVPHIQHIFASIGVFEVPTTLAESDAALGLTDGSTAAAITAQMERSDLPEPTRGAHTAQAVSGDEAARLKLRCTLCGARNLIQGCATFRTPDMPDDRPGALCGPCVEHVTRTPRIRPGVRLAMLAGACLADLLPPAALGVD